MLPADRKVRLIAADLDLLASVHWFAVLEPQIHSSFFVTEPADGFQFFNFVCVQQ